MLRCMQQPAQSPPSSAPANFAGMLEALASPTPEDPGAAKAWGKSDLGDDVVKLSYDSALRARARYQTADKNEGPLTREVQTGAGIAQDAVNLPAASPGGGLHAQASKVLRDDCDLRSASVTIRLSKAECARLHKHAAEAGVTVSAYLRSCTFEAEALRAEVKTALAELRSTGPSRWGGLVPASFHFEHQALQVFGLGQVEHNGMVGSGAAALEQADAPRCIGCGRGDCALEIGPGHMMRAGAGNEKSAGARHLERTEIQLLVAA